MLLEDERPWQWLLELHISWIFRCTTQQATSLQAVNKDPKVRYSSRVCAPIAEYEVMTQNFRLLDLPRSSWELESRHVWLTRRNAHKHSCRWTELQTIITRLQNTSCWKTAIVDQQAPLSTMIATFVDALIVRWSPSPCWNISCMIGLLMPMVLYPHDWYGAQTEFSRGLGQDRQLNHALQISRDCRLTLHLSPANSFVIFYSTSSYPQQVSRCSGNLEWQAVPRLNSWDRSEFLRVIFAWDPILSSVLVAPWSFSTQIPH